MNLFSWLRSPRPGSPSPSHKPPRSSARLACEPLEDRALMSATLSISDAWVNEGTGGTKLMHFTVTLSESSAQPVTVDYATADGSASGKTDYTAAAGTLTFAAGETVKTVSVEVTGDSRAEDRESFRVNLSGPVNAAISDPLGVGVIHDDDARDANRGGGYYKNHDR